jgi:hypothetical protein
VRKSALCPVLWLAAIIPRVAHTQATRDSVVVYGRVTTQLGAPLPGARVTITAARRTATRSVNTDSLGAYRIAIAHEGEEYSAEVLALGYVAARRTLHIAPGDDSIACDVRLLSAAPKLERMVTRAERPRPIHDASVRRPTPGANQQLLDLQTGLSGNLSGDVSSALVMVPGVVLTPTASGSLAPSAFGVSPESNGATLNGSVVSGTLLPRDGLRQTVRLSTYDPKQGRYAGLQVSSNLPSGTGYRDRVLHLTIDHPALQSSTLPAFTPRYSEAVVSGRLSGPVLGRRFYSGAFQVGSVVRPTETLTSVDSSALRAMGVQPESLSRALSVARSLGLPIGVSNTGPAVVTNASAIARVDFTNGAGPLIDTREPVLYVLGSAGTSSARRQGLSALSVSTRSTHTTRREGQLMAVYAPYFSSALSETKVTLVAHDDHTTSDTFFPSVTLLLNSGDADGATYVSPVTLGGSGTPERSNGYWRGEASNLTSWTTWGRAQVFEAYTEASLEKGHWENPGAALGAFTFGSIADLASAKPARFYRTLSGTRSAATAARATFALSDIIAIGKRAREAAAANREDGLRVQLGLRLDADRFSDRPQRDRLVDSLFGRRNDHLPNSIIASPMAGFTWTQGLYQVTSGPVLYTDTRNTVSGGIRLYQGTVSLDDFQAVRRRSGLASDGPVDLECVGSAAPTPNWAAYTIAPSDIPDRCTGVSTPSSQTAPSVTFYPPGFRSARSLRAELNWRWLVSGHLYGFLGSTVALNDGDIDPYDLNLLETPALALAREANRPVYAASDLISPISGLIPLSASRRSTDVRSVLELRPSRASRVRQLTGGVEYRIGASRFLSPEAPDPPRFTAILRASYTRADGRARSSGFTASTAGDPRVVSWSPALVPRHTMQFVLNGQLDGWFSLSAAAVLRSGIPYTPMIAGDVNGDGLWNDRAFVFRPTESGANDVDVGMEWLLRHAPSGARRCLERQLGMIAREGSCVGPWTASVGTIALAIDPYRLRLGNRGSLTVFANNVLGGIDELLHGRRALRGWGKTASADATLLSVRGFDSADKRYLYAVNSQFGRRDVATLGPSPFRLTVDFRLDVGPDRETQFIQNRMIEAATLARSPHPTAEDVKLRLLSIAQESASRDLRRIIALADSLGLTAVQRDSIESVAETYQASRDSIYGELASRLVELNGAYGGENARVTWHNAITASIETKYAAARRVRGLLTAEQLRWLQERGMASSLNYSEAWLRRLTRGPLVPQ